MALKSGWLVLMLNLRTPVQTEYDYLPLALAYDKSIACV